VKLLRAMMGGQHIAYRKAIKDSNKLEYVVIELEDAPNWVMRSASHRGTLPPWSGRWALPARRAVIDYSSRTIPAVHALLSRGNAQNGAS
jgi:hypothetical protein